MNIEKWKVVPLSEAQLLDMRFEDILEEGLYRKCNTYRGGGGYDRFPELCELLLNKKYMYEQFVVQLYGCHLDCPYCYVTRAGVWGKPILVTTDELLDAFKRSEQQVFHLMGGAPAIHIAKWPELLEKFEARFSDCVFHSDLLLTERVYKQHELAAMSSVKNAIFAINIKGVTLNEHRKNTRKKFLHLIFWQNLTKLAFHKNIKCYITFTNVSQKNIDYFWKLCIVLPNKIVNAWQTTAYSIDLIDYKAVEFVDAVKWGPTK